MATLPVYNPLIPYLALIPGGLRHGVMIRIKGQMTAHHNRFAVNIQTGPALRPCDDINLHLSVRPSEHVIVRNHMVRQIWGTEERYGNCPISQGQFFEILILAETNAFKVAINGTHFCEFVHRIPLNRAQYVAINGDGLTIHSIVLEGDVASAPPMPPPSYVHDPFPQPPPPYPSSASPYPVMPGQPYNPNPSYYPAGAAPIYSSTATYPNTVFLKKEFE